MRQHCRTQHNFDPFPGFHPSPIKSEATDRGKGLPIRISNQILKRILDIVDIAERSQQMRSGNLNNDLSNRSNSFEHALNYISENFSPADKRDIQGISAYFCTQCHTFEIKYVMNIATDIDARGGHVHIPLESVINSRDYENREKAYRLLIDAVNSVFYGQKFLESIPYPTQNILEFRGPSINLPYLSTEHWTLSAIRSGQISIDDELSNSIVKQMSGTYVLTRVKGGQYRGYHLVRVTSYPGEVSRPFRGEQG